MDDSERSYGYSRDIYHGRRGPGGHYQPAYRAENSVGYYPGIEHFQRSYEFAPEVTPSIPRRDSFGPEEEAMHVRSGPGLGLVGVRVPGGATSQSWDVPGPHRGRGPRGYRRSDERMREDVCDRLQAHGHLDASDVEVTVEDGEVTLAGTVPDRATKRLAEDVAETVRGIVDVHNRLVLEGRGGEPAH